MWLERYLGASSSLVVVVKGGSVEGELGEGPAAFNGEGGYVFALAFMSF